MTEAAPRGPVRVEIVVHDEKNKKSGLRRLLYALAFGFTGAGLAALAGSFAVRGLVTWQQAPASLAQCKGPVEAAVDTALGDFLLWQMLLLGGGFLFAFVVAVWRLFSTRKDAA